MKDSYAELTDEQQRRVADLSSQVAQTFVCAVQSQVEQPLRPFVLRTVCGVVLGSQVAQDIDPDAIRSAVAIAMHTVRGDLEAAEGGLGNHDGSAPS